MGESINNKYKLSHVDESRENIIITINLVLIVISQSCMRVMKTLTQ